MGDLQLDGEIKHASFSDEALAVAFLAWLESIGARFDGYAHLMLSDGDSLPTDCYGEDALPVRWRGHPALTAQPPKP